MESGFGSCEVDRPQISCPMNDTKDEKDEAGARHMTSDAEDEVGRYEGNCWDSGGIIVTQ